MTVPDAHWLPPPANPERYVLGDVRIPPALTGLDAGGNGWCEADVLIAGGRIEAVKPAGSFGEAGAERVNASHGILLSGLVDCHTHVDKAHVAAFTDFPPTDLAGAIEAMVADKNTWTRESMARRVDFSLRSAFAYGVRAMRSHVDFAPPAPDFAWQVMREAVTSWQGRIELQLTPLGNILQFEDPDYRKRLDAACDAQGILGFFVYDQPDLEARLRAVFDYAAARGWDLDLHVDEGLEASLDGLNAVAEAALATRFSGRVLCGHCVALNSYDQARRDRVIERALEAGLHFVSLPITNLYLQGREDDGIPRQRGMTPVRHLVERGATVSLGSDNVRDAFCAFGEFDPVAALTLGAQVGHLDEPARDWAALITSAPACSMGLAWQGRIEPGAPADLVLFSARSSSELSARGGMPRIVVRDGEWVSAKAPDFRELRR